MTPGTQTTSEFVRPPTFDPYDVDRLDDADLDEQPFGVICVDPDGLILRYNLAEARLARLDRNRVIGRNFFRDIAPCTQTEEFEGRFRKFAQRPTQSIVRFDYVFDFKFGAQQVNVELLHVRDTRRFYFVVNRTSIGPARGAEARAPAPLQAELVPPSSEPGVVRDERGQRVFRTTAPMFEAMMRTGERLAPETWTQFCREWGLQWGRRAVVELEVEALERTDRSLADRSMEEVSARVAELAAEQGWGRLNFDFTTIERGAVAVQLDNSLLAEAARRAVGPRCQLFAGFLEAVFTHLAGRRLGVRELRCRADGAPHCEFGVLGPARARLVDERGLAMPLSQLLDELDRIAEALARGSNGHEHP